MASGLSDKSPLNDWLAWQEQCHVKEIDLGLERVATVYNRVKNTASASIYTITVAGTNGKGSCVALLESILIAGGYQVGVYSTPHISRYNERIRINGQTVSDGVLTAAFAHIDQHRQDTSLSYFEWGTLAALDVFNTHLVDVQILEVGLGGRLDAVNIIDADATLISSISVDHIDWLGDDISKIAVEKAGVFRAHQKAVCGDRTVPTSLLDYANELNTNLIQAGTDFDIAIQHDGWELLADHAFSGCYSFPALKGQHQIQNAAAVVSLLAHIDEALAVKQEHIHTGLQAVNLTGRLQQVHSQPDVFLDVAHNEESASALATFIQSRPNIKRVQAVFSCLADKQLLQIVQPFIGIVGQWHIASLNANRSESIENLDQLLRVQLSQNCVSHQSIQDAYQQVTAKAEKDDLVICFGSFYVVEACLDAL